MKILVIAGIGLILGGCASTSMVTMSDGTQLPSGVYETKILSENSVKCEKLKAKYRQDKAIRGAKSRGNVPTDPNARMAYENRIAMESVTRTFANLFDSLNSRNSGCLDGLVAAKNTEARKAESKDRLIGQVVGGVVSLGTVGFIATTVKSVVGDVARSAGSSTNTYNTNVSNDNGSTSTTNTIGSGMFADGGSTIATGNSGHIASPDSSLTNSGQSSTNPSNAGDSNPINNQNNSVQNPNTPPASTAPTPGN